MGNCLRLFPRIDSARISHSPNASSTSPTLIRTSYSEKSASENLLIPQPELCISPSPNLKAFNFNDLKNATRNFRVDSLIGEGGFGYVFKGWIDEQTFSAARPGYGLVVAVKMLKPEGFQGHREWLAEVNYLGQLHHPNLVRLIGYCSDGDDRLLVYEFMPKGSLENHLFRRGPQPLSWATRLKIAIGASKGLSFLHDSECQVIYMEVSRHLTSSSIRISVQNFQTLAWRKLVLLAIRLMFRLESWGHRVMLPRNTLPQVVSLQRLMSTASVSCCLSFSQVAVPSIRPSQVSNKTSSSGRNHTLPTSESCSELWTPSWRANIPKNRQT